VASQEVIKLMGTNGGGFMNANSAHPFENPGALTNLIQILLPHPRACAAPGHGDGEPRTRSSG
jgi:K+-transporting ATPase A subunit